MTTEILIKVMLVVLFLLYAYFMIGGYTPCPFEKPYPEYFNEYEYMMESTNRSLCLNSQSYDQNYENTFYNRKADKNIYQMGPYLNF